ncbi:putative GntR family transcriptional regulator [Actinacidiphila reveromycinica]|uniref:Putative GntR family transcriptional regulator n=1 Tax=Actinacidiphila reveromycinica TaxID=659352 RepID=A0A7U3UX83_9ACTN|nr:GntR family transcriptional regulator [Streptomyces sp. SN-593]BBB00279.1 putative GntR family transcriptional regulator [Streptomyces sp. SN-593]
MSTGSVANMVDDLRRQIDAGDLGADERIPSTRVLMETYALSDNAVYRGIALLKAESYVYSRQGKGVFVRDRRALIAGARRIQGITQAGEHIEWRHSIRTDAPSWVAEHLGVGECVERARTVRRGDLVLQASRSWVHLDVTTDVPELDEPRPCDPTWQAVYTERSGNPVQAASKVVDARLASAEDCEALGLAPDTYAVMIMRSVYVTGDRVIGVGETVYAPGHPVDLKVS